MKEIELFFLEEIQIAIDLTKLKLNDNLVSYLNNLLAINYNNNLSKTYLSDLYKDCLEAKNKNEKFLKNKLLGDSSLITVGFFRDSIKRKQVSENYYIDMGKLAYQNASTCALDPQLFNSLSYHYEKCSNLLNEVSVHIKVCRDKDLLKVLEIWNITKSLSAQKRLAELGFVSRTEEE